MVLDFTRIFLDNPALSRYRAGKIMAFYARSVIPKDTNPS